MPLSKKRQAEYMRAYRAKKLYLKEDSVIPSHCREMPSKKLFTFVQPKDILKAIEYLDNAPVPTKDRKIWLDGEVVPIPKCLDGRYRDATN